MEILYIAILIVILTAGYAGYRAAPWVPTGKEGIKRTLALADVKKGDVFFDLGSGDGRLLKSASEKGVEAQGFEISLLPYLTSLMRLHGNKSAKVFFKDFWNEDFGKADIIYFFLTPRIMKKLKEKIERECKTGTKIISYVWKIDGWKEVAMSSAPKHPSIYLYIK